MFSLSICFGSVVWALRFKTESAAVAAHKIILDPTNNEAVVDDFGQTLSVRTGAIAGVMLEDMSKSREAHIGQMLHNASMQTEAQRRAQTQPRSPNIVTPFVGGMPAR